MSDSDPSQKKPGVPSWQLSSKDTTPAEADTDAESEAGAKAETQRESPSRESVIEQAKRFLQEDEVRNASTDKKISFLESKGLTSEEIQTLLGVTRNPEASAQAPAHTQDQNSSPSPQSQPTYSSPPPRDIPPIITYPEFLTTPQHPTPLVTTSRLRATLYLFGALSALIYGTSNYLVTPMVEALTASRLSLAETATTNLSKLITKLESVVSEIPPEKPRSRAGRTGEGEMEVDEESDEDPTKMFHRDIGIQTSLPPTPSSGPASSPPSSSSAINDQATRLKSISTSVTSLLEDSTSEGHDISDLSTTVGILREYLDGLAYVMPSYGYGTGGYGSGPQADDEIGKVKASIRSVKGVLLSARSFPSVVRPVR